VRLSYPADLCYIDSGKMPPSDVDEATQKQLSKLRIRGAPAIKPGMPNFVGEYACREVQMTAVRALSLGWAEGVAPTRALIREAFARLAAVAKEQKLKPEGDPMWVCLADPYLVEPPKRSYAAFFPFRGAAREEGDVKVSRIEGGFYIATATERGIPDLENVYTFLFGRFLPSKSHVLARPAILHRILGTRDGIPVDEAMDRDLLVEVWVPAGFEMIKRDPSVTEGAG
jgi:DNA gyrase inhibitor GyrI